MAKSVKVKIDGLDQLAAKFKQLDQATQSRVLVNAVRSGSIPIQNKAVVNCPVDTGNLRRSIHTEITTPTTHSAVAEIGTDVDYAPHVEFGTRRSMRAQPYLRPAFDTEKDNAVTEIGLALKQQLEFI